MWGPIWNAAAIAAGLDACTWTTTASTWSLAACRCSGPTVREAAARASTSFTSSRGFQGDRVLPEAVIEVWSRETNGELSRIWSLDGKPLTISYDEFKVHGDRSHGD